MTTSPPPDTLEQIAEALVDDVANADGFIDAKRTAIQYLRDAEDRGLERAAQEVDKKARFDWRPFEYVDFIRALKTGAGK